MGVDLLGMMACSLILEKQVETLAPKSSGIVLFKRDFCGFWGGTIPCFCESNFHFFALFGLFKSIKNRNRLGICLFAPKGL
jgi:hypothetical protein